MWFFPSPHRAAASQIYRICLLGVHVAMSSFQCWPWANLFFLQPQSIAPQPVCKTRGSLISLGYNIYNPFWSDCGRMQGVEGTTFLKKSKQFVTCALYACQPAKYAMWVCSMHTGSPRYGSRISLPCRNRGKHVLGFVQYLDREPSFREKKIFPVLHHGQVWLGTPGHPPVSRFPFRVLGGAVSRNTFQCRLLWTPNVGIC